jgi:hypothetical protein
VLKLVPGVSGGAPETAGAASALPWSYQVEIWQYLSENPNAASPRNRGKKKWKLTDKATTHNLPAHGIEQTVVQSENPAQTSRQDQETVKTKSYTVPARSRMEDTRFIADAGGAPVTNATALVISAPMPVVEHEETRAKTELGAAQKDTARELSAKLASLKGIVWVGVVVFLFGLATLFYPPLRLIIGSVTTSVAIVGGGLALIVLPSLIVGNELLILAGVAAAVGLWFFAYRHGSLRGLVNATQSPAPTSTQTNMVETTTKV